MVVDKVKILETADKTFKKLYDEMVANYDDSHAKTLYEFYSKQSFDFIGEHFFDIAKEARYGTNFLLELLYMDRPDRFFVFFYDIIKDMLHSWKAYLVTVDGKLNQKQNDLYTQLLGLLERLNHEKYWAIDYVSRDLSDRAVILHHSIRENLCFHNEESIEKTTEKIAKILVDNYETKELSCDTLLPIAFNLNISLSAPYEYQNKLYEILTSIFKEGNQEYLIQFLKRYISDDDGNAIIYCIQDHKDTELYQVIQALKSYDSLDRELELRFEMCREDITHGNRFNAVTDVILESFDLTDYSTEKAFIESSVQALYINDIELLTESYINDSKFNSNDYSMLNPDITTYEEAFAFLNDKTDSIYFKEDSTPDTVEKIDKVATHNKPSESISNKIKHKAMDYEAKSNKRRAERQESLANISGAAKAVSNIPKNFTNGIKDIIEKIDDKDDERRKKFMIKPGFRKHAFKTLKLAIMYGSAAQVKLSMIPVVAIIRHFSKEKDIRIRNELEKELETEIKVTEEKINDASANGDQQAKYKLIRIKEKLEQEKDRIKYNTKYI